MMLEFSESVSFDRRLALFDIEGSKAHSAMLAHVGLLSGKERDAIHRGLDAIAAEITAGKFTWDTRLEDVHMNIEQALTQRVPAAAKLHTARSRNDQVATDMRLWFKHACAALDAKLAAAQHAILATAEREAEVFIPGYTHLQRAQPVGVAHQLAAYLEMLERDRGRRSVFTRSARAAAAPVVFCEFSAIRSRPACRLMWRPEGVKACKFRTPFSMRLAVERTAPSAD